MYSFSLLLFLAIRPTNALLTNTPTKDLHILTQVPENIKGIPRLVLLNSSLCAHSSVSLSHPALPVFFLPTFPLLVFCVLLPPPYLAVSVQHTPLLLHFLPVFFSRCAPLCFLILFILNDGGVQRGDAVYVGSTSGLLMCSSDRSVLCRRMDVGVCFHTRMVVCLCPCVRLSGAATQGQQQPFELRMSNLPLHVVLKLLSTASLCFLLLTPSFSPSISLTLFGCLSPARWCMTENVCFAVFLESV